MDAAVCIFPGRSRNCQQLSAGAGRGNRLCPLAPNSPGSNLAGLCGAAAGYTGIFCDVLECLRPGFSHCIGPNFDWSTCCLGLCTLLLSMEADAVHLVHHSDAAALPSDHGFQLFCAGLAGADEYCMGDHSARSGIYIPGISDDPLFAAIPSTITEAAALDGAGPLQIFWYLGLPLGAPGILSAVVLGFLEYWNALEQPLTFLKDKTLWPLSVSADGNTGKCSRFVGSFGYDAAAGAADFLIRTKLLGGGH